MIVVKSTSGGSTVRAKGGNDRICGGPVADFLLGGGGNDRLRGNGGVDSVLGQGGDDQLYGDGDEGELDYAVYFLAKQGVNVNLSLGSAQGEGTDALYEIDGVAGSDFDDTITGDDLSNSIITFLGNDTVDGMGNVDLITPGAGDDQVDGGEDGDLGDMYGVIDATGPTTVNLQAGTASGGGMGNDTLVDFEHVFGSPFDDTMIGNEKLNIFAPGAGNDSVDGGAGFDYATFWFAEAPVDASLARGTSIGASATDAQGNEIGEGTDTLLNLEGLLGSIQFGDTLTGDNAGNVLNGEGGDDVLVGNDGNDLFMGELGEDTVNGGPGTNDLWEYFGDDPVTIDLPAGSATASATDVSLSGVESIGGSDAADTLTGDDLPNRIFGYGGDDNLLGNAGDDLVDGGPDTDSVDPGPGTDTCSFVEVWGGPCEITAEGNPVHSLQAPASIAIGIRRHI